MYWAESLGQDSTPSHCLLGRLLTTQTVHFIFLTPTSIPGGKEGSVGHHCILDSHPQDDDYTVLSGNTDLEGRAMFSFSATLMGRQVRSSHYQYSAMYGNEDS